MRATMPALVLLFACSMRRAEPAAACPSGRGKTAGAP
jgi:hypothetical protein